MIRQRLPIGIQTFREIREGGHYYVDKTGFAARLAEQGKAFFLSRPRRFGKSLFLDTLAELWSGNAELFRGLYAEQHWDFGQRHPVVRLSFADGVIEDRGQLDEKIRELLTDNEQRLGVAGEHQSISGRFHSLLRVAEGHYGARVVVLVDEYDKPMLDNLTRPEVARELRDGLRNLYSVIKGADAHVRFAFLTGVSKFSKVSLFSGLNNLNDITVDAAYSAICGYTEADLDQVFGPELAGLDREQIRAWYNGYNWTGEAVYNPFDLLLLFQKRLFRPWWFETATPTFLVDLLTARQTFLPDLERLVASEQLLAAFDMEQIATEALLFQSGYLTIDRVRQMEALVEYGPRYPNLEVRASLTGALRYALAAPDTGLTARTARLYELLQANDFAGLEQLFTAFFASIPADWYRNNPIARYEGYYASVFYGYFASLGLDLTPEAASNAGRLDLALRFNGQVYLFEFKVVELAPKGRALQQIKDRGYAAPCLALGVPVHLIGVEFSRKRRAVVGFAVEHLNDG